MTIPSFSDSQRGNQEAAANHYRLRNGELDAENAELRSRLSVERARIRGAVRALTAGDADGALRVLTEEAKS
jgi:hypothetical protein